MASAKADNGLPRFKMRLPFLPKEKHRTFILPTPFGLAFGTTALILFFMAVGYGNNLIFIFLFFLVSVAWTAMVMTNRNLHGLEKMRVHQEELFAGETGAIQLHILNNSRLHHYEVEARFHKSDEVSNQASFAPHTEQTFSLPFVGETRGAVQLPGVTIQSAFPFSLWRAWKRIPLNESVIVYPYRDGSHIFPTDSHGDMQSRETGLFREHRAYVRGDSVRHIDWKATARKREVLIKKLEEPQNPALSFSWEQTEHITGIEDRLSQLALWIDLAERQNSSYSLSLGIHHVPENHGKAHWQKCLETLALARPEDLP